MKIWPLLFLLGGCATSLDNLIEQRSACLSEGCPDELHIEIDLREARIQKREEIKAAWERVTWCPPSYAFYCADFWCRQREQRRMPEPRISLTSGCVRTSELGYALGSRF